MGAIQNRIILIRYTEVGVSNFTLSADKSNNTEIYLWILFVLATFSLCLHLLNMLIAIMGDI